MSDVTIEVEPEPVVTDDAPDVVVIDTGDAATTDHTDILVALSERVTRLEDTVTVLGAAVEQVSYVAQDAQITADVALDVTSEVAAVVEEETTSEPEPEPTPDETPKSKKSRWWN